MSSVVEQSWRQAYPTGTAWRGKDGGYIEDVNNACATVTQYGKEQNEDIKNDFFPQTTTLLTEWLFTLALINSGGQSDQASRSLITAAWQRAPILSLTVQNQIYALNDFDVIVRNLEDGEDPTDIAQEGQLTQYSDNEFFGGDTQFGGEDIGLNTFVLRNGIPEIQPPSYQFSFGSSNQFGGVDPFLNFGAQDTVQQASFTEYESPPIPQNSDYWGLIYIIEGQGGNRAQIPAVRRQDFFALTFKIKPLFMWAIARVDFV